MALLEKNSSIRIVVYAAVISCPDIVRFVDELPYTETGKLLRRVVLADLEADRPSGDAT